MRLLLVLFLFFGAYRNAEAVQKQSSKPFVKEIDKKSAALKLDSSKVDIRTIDKNAVENFSKQKEFIYDDVAPAKIGIWDRFWRWFWRMLSKLLSGGIGGSIIKYILIGLAIGLVVFVAIKLIGIDYKQILGKSKPIVVPYEESLENIHEIDFDDQLDQALKNKDYRLAVRLLYLKTLKHLTDKQLIDWQVEKTNQTYVTELENEKYKTEFTVLTNQFEYIWYGEFHIDRPTFQLINVSFHEFNQKAI